VSRVECCHSRQGSNFQPARAITPATPLGIIAWPAGDVGVAAFFECRIDFALGWRVACQMQLLGVQQLALPALPFHMHHAHFSSVPAFQ